MKKKVFILLYCTIILFSLSFKISNAYKYTSIKMNGSYFGFFLDEPYIKNKTVMLPLADIADFLRFDLDWNSKEKKILITGTQNDVTIYLSSKTAYIGKNKYKFETPPEIINSKLYVPISFFEKAFNAQIKWDIKNKNLDIVDNKIKRVYKTNSNAFIKGDLKSNLATFPSEKEKDSKIKVDLFGQVENFTLVLGEELEKNTQNIIGYWNSMSTIINKDLKKSDLYKNDKLVNKAIIQAAFADLDKDGTLELILAIRDEIIDGEFYIIKLHNNYQLSENQKELTLMSEILAKEYFQTEIQIDKNGHIIIPIGTQGLFNEYKLKNNKLIEIKK